MRKSIHLRYLLKACLALGTLLSAPVASDASELCPDEQALPQVPTDPQLCAPLLPVVRAPHALPLNEYEQKLGNYLRAFCYRDTAGGWKTDKTVRDTGPFIATLTDGKWSGTYYGTHAPVIVWYSPDMYRWLKTNRPADLTVVPATPAPVPDGAIMVKEMYSRAPASSCRGIDPMRLKPNTQGVAVMVRDSAGSRDGWFWGWFGWSNWQPDWQPQSGNPMPMMGFGQYCTNCHASARDNSSFASLANIKGEPGDFLSFLSQDFFLTQSDQVHTSFAPVLRLHARLAEEDRAAAETVRALQGAPIDRAFMAALHVPGLQQTADIALQMPSQTYDTVWVEANGPHPSSEFITSDQCLGCHSSGGTGLQYPMTEPVGDKMRNLSPYGTWRTSPMGLAGRDPVFFAQLASETDTFHKDISAATQDTCLGCHGVMGDRQFHVDQAIGPEECKPFLRPMTDAVPYPPDNPGAPLARYGALARDGVSCAACHHMVLGQADVAKYLDQPQNRCVRARQEFLNPDTTGFARSFTGSFVVGAPDTTFGPFADPKTKPMANALGLTPAKRADITSSEVCGTCHTVHLPVMDGTTVVTHVYEQATYAEWAFSAYRTGTTPDGPLPLGPGALSESCQGCHMPSTDAKGAPFRSKIAAIQEHSSFPQVENGLGAEDIDLPLRNGFAQHTLVGLNVFLIDMASQFPEVLGIRTQDPMMGDDGVDPLALTRQRMFEQAARASAEIAIARIETASGMLNTTVTVTNKTGHKFPSGVGFRRAFVDFRLLDEAGRVIWESGRTDRAGVIVDQRGEPVAGELWWSDDCTERLNPGRHPHQPHYQVIGRQDQVQIYQELVTAPPSDGTPPHCGHDAEPLGPLTTSFLSICAPLKDNRLLPSGFLSHQDRVKIADALGAGPDLADDTDPVAVGSDPDYRSGGGDSLVYSIPLAEVHGRPAAVEATLYYQAMPPFFLQDRFCTSHSEDTKRLSFLASQLSLAGTRAEDWKLRMVSTGPVPLTR